MSVAQAQADVADVADNVKDILDGMAADWRASWPEDHAEFEPLLDAKIDELKAQVDAQAQEKIDNLTAWYD